MTSNLTIPEFVELFPEDAEVSLGRTARVWHVGVVLATGEQFHGADLVLDTAMDQVLGQLKGGVLVKQMTEAQAAIVYLHEVRARHPGSRVLLLGDTDHAQFWLVQRDHGELPRHVEIPRAQLGVGPANPRALKAVQKFRGLRLVLDSAFPQDSTTN